jgi:hypothetical protein
MRLSKQLARNRFRQAPKPRAASNNPPAQAVRTAKLRTAVRQLRQTARGDPDIVAVCDEAQKLIDSGWVERKGGGERTRPLPLPKELRPYAAQWKKPPPEWGEK